MTNNFDAILHALDLNTNARVFDPATADRLEAWRPAIAGTWLAGSQRNPLALLQSLVIDEDRGSSLDSDEFERITGLSSCYACEGASLAGLSPDAVLQAVGKLALCVLAAWRNQVRADGLGPAGLTTGHEEAASAADEFLAVLSADSAGTVVTYRAERLAA